MNPLCRVTGHRHIIHVDIVARRITSTRCSRCTPTMEEASMIRIITAWLLCGLAVRIMNVCGLLVPNQAEREVRNETTDLAERGRRLASEREDLIAQGIDPRDLDIPLHPEHQNGDR